MIECIQTYCQNKDGIKKSGLDDFLTWMFDVLDDIINNQVTIEWLHEYIRSTNKKSAFLPENY